MPQEGLVALKPQVVAQEEDLVTLVDLVSVDHLAEPEEYREEVDEILEEFRPNLPRCDPILKEEYVVLHLFSDGLFQLLQLEIAHH